MKRVLLLTTGGTIASVAAGHGLIPQLNSGELIGYVPELTTMCHFDTLALLSLDSTNMNPSLWLKIARAIEENYTRYDAFVITHGTDTLAYTAAALSYLVQNSRKPVVLTGSQKSIAHRDTDARRNLLDAFRFALEEEASGVKLVFDGQVMLGTRVRKTHSQSFGAFSSIDYPIVASMRRDHVLHYLLDHPQGSPQFYHALNDRVSVLKLIPGLRPEIMQLTASASDAVIIEGFGVGGLPNLSGWNLAALAASLMRDGKIMVMSTQVLHEGSDMEVYQVGHDLKHQLGMLEAYTMTPEALVAKLMWILARTKDLPEVEKLLYTRIDHDIL